MDIARRNSKYKHAVIGIVKYFGHATNARIAEDLRRSYPHISDTTVHRITQSLAEDSQIKYAPNTVSGSMVFDANLKDHDHFLCIECEKLYDMNVSMESRNSIMKDLDECNIDGPLTIEGTCRDCS